jgi:benzoyl-CoA reductase/2-hydroxyglutaryl-CoA dehydratase subunit BcrC/BadD/HgdB
LGDFEAVDLRKHIRGWTENYDWRKYVTFPQTYSLLGFLSWFWRPGKLERHLKDSFLFGVRLLSQAYGRKRPVVWANIYTPAELIWAWGGIPFFPEAAAAVAASLGWSVHFLKTAEGAWFSTDLCSFHRCALGMALEKILPRPDLVIATNNLCDGAAKFLEIAAGIYGCPYFLLSVPYTDSPQSRAWLAEDILALQREVKKLLPARQEEIARVIAYVNTTRKHMVAVNNLRRSLPSPWRGSEALTQVIVFFNALGTGEGLSFYRSLEKVLGYRVAKGLPAVPDQRKRLLWLHFKPFYPNPLLDLVEIGHRAVLAFEEVSEVFWEEIPQSDYAGGIAAKILANPLWGPAERRVKLVIDLARAYRVDGVIHFAHWGCRQSTGSVHLLRTALGREGIPFLNLDGDCIDPRNYMEGQTATRIEGFLEMLR